MPYNLQYRDVYFQNQLVDEVQHVFIAGNALAERFAQLPAHSIFTLAELGFGTGANCLLCLELWKKMRPQASSWLHYVSFEAMAFGRESLQEILGTIFKAKPSLHPLIEDFLAEYPTTPIAGCYPLVLPQYKCVVYLLLGDVASHTDFSFHANAWLLDGFAPRHNADLWGQVAEILATKSAAGATVASFSVARVLKDALRQAGFQWQLKPGFGKKKQMLMGCLPLENERSKCGNPAVGGHSGLTRINKKLDSCFRRNDGACFETLSQEKNKPSNPQKITIIGGGLSACWQAYFLTLLGHRVQIIAPSIADEASGVPWASLYPRFFNAHTEFNAFYLQAYFFAYQWLVKLGFSSGTFYDFSPAQFQHKQQAIQALAEQSCGNLRLGNCAGIESALAMQSIALCPKELCLKLLALSNPEHITSSVQKLESHESAWQLSLEGGRQLEAEKLVVCTSYKTPLLLERLENQVFPLAGQSTKFASSSFANWSEEQNILALHAEKSILPVEAGAWVQASYRPQSADKSFCKKEEWANRQAFLQVARQVLPQDLQENLNKTQAVESFVGVRCSSKDHLPLVGELEAGLYTNLAHASRGLCTIPLCSLAVACAISGLPPVFSRVVGELLRPGRFGG